MPEEAMYRGSGLGVRFKNANSHTGDHRDGESRAHLHRDLHSQIVVLFPGSAKIRVPVLAQATSRFDSVSEGTGSLAVAIAIFVAALLAERALYILAGIHVPYRWFEI